MGYFGLLGYPLGHSFSKPWFEARGHRYDNFAFERVDEFIETISSELDGFNVTIPHKESIIKHLDLMDEAAQKIGAVNCVKILANGQKKGYNTDAIGFRNALVSMIGHRFEGKAAVLGSGGASKAVCWVLDELGIPYSIISRGNGGYDTLKIADYRLIINTSPVGMYPNTQDAPAIDYDKITSAHFMYDLVYNPAQTEFIRHGRKRGATVCNGLSMLHAQAQAALLHFVEP